MADIYRNNIQYLKDEILRLDLLLHLGILKLRKSLPDSPQDTIKWLLLTDQEIDDILMERDTDPKKQEETDPQINSLINAIEQLKLTISEKKKASMAKGTYLALPRLSRLFGLSPFEEQSVLICLAPELNRKYKKLYAYLQDDMTRKNPSPDLILSLLCTTQEEIMIARSCFLPQAPLIKKGIIQIMEDSQYPHPPLLWRSLKLDDRIVNFLLGINVPDSRIESFSKLILPKADISEAPISQESKTQLITLTKRHFAQSNEQPRSLILYLYGPYGSGRQSLAEAICKEINLPLIISDMEELLARDLPFEDALRLIFREAMLQPAAIYLKGIHPLLGAEEKHHLHLKIIERAIDEFSLLTFLAGEKNWEPGALFTGNTFVKVPFQAPEFAAQTELWKEMTNGRFQFSPEVDFNEFTSKFRFTPGQIKDALSAAQNLALLQDPDEPEITMQDLYQGCRAQCNQKLGSLAQKIIPHYTWEDIVLPGDTLQQLHAICNQMKYKHLVYGKWGFGQKLSLGKGLHALFSGPSGTGKTMAAEIIANNLQLDLYKIDLSSVVSKYIGETEKNLSRIFYEAESSNAILFFDEADALFGKRSEVKDAHDRYANIEIGYLLQKMEEYEGISILATNLRRNIDNAFLRRLHFLVEFPFPDEKYRYQIWKKIFPKDAPIHKNIDFTFLSDHLKITGGNIKNIAVNAAFMAAGNSGSITMEHIIQSTMQEYKKIGRPYVRSEFGKYAGLIMVEEM
ncbi:MAG: AAA family ATPase [bacterium]